MTKKVWGRVNVLNSQNGPRICVSCECWTKYSHGGGFQWPGTRTVHSADGILLPTPPPRVCSVGSCTVWPWWLGWSLSVALRIQTSGLPWWRSGWESACQCRGHRFEPWSGKIPHAAEQLGPWATITEPAHVEPVLCNKRGHDSERPAHRDEEWPPLAATRESPSTETKTQHSHK